MSMDARVAAEILHRAVEQARGHDAESPHEPLSYQWLSERPASLDSALSDLHLSPHPPLVIGVEGETEQAVLPRVFDALGIVNDPNYIRIECFGGTTKDLALLARFAASPRLGEDRKEFVELDRPVTRFLVLTDAENNYATRAKRRKQRLLLLDSIAFDVPKNLKPDLYGRDSHLVEIRTWGRYPFEFAHFTDAQLADALLSLSDSQPSGGRVGLIAAIHRERMTTSPNISDAWRDAKMSKVKLMDALWPLLERRINLAMERGQKGPPIMVAALRACELANTSRNLKIVLRRRRWRKPVR